MNKLIYILPERLRRRFQFYRANLYPMWFKIEYVNKRGKHWVPFSDLENLIRSDVLIYSTEIHDIHKREIHVSGENPLFDNMLVSIPSVQDIVDKHNEVKQIIKVINEDNEDTESAKEDGDVVSEDAQSGSQESL